VASDQVEPTLPNENYESINLFGGDWRVLGCFNYGQPDSSRPIAEQLHGVDKEDQQSNNT